MRPILGSAAVAVLVGGLLLGCEETNCNPVPPRASPSTVALGGDVVVSSTGSPCGEDFDGDRAYDAEMLFLGRADPLPLGEVEVAGDGSFSATFTVPPGIPPGEAVVSFTPVPFERADGGSCAGYGASFGTG